MRLFDLLLHGDDFVVHCVESELNAHMEIIHKKINEANMYVCCLKILQINFDHRKC